jgi:hypothetical protein
MDKWGVHEQRIAKIQEEWNKAEKIIKLAEQICGEVVFPSIMELRYAGRRIIDALHSVCTEDDSEKVDSLLQDAEYDCHRARHDAIDASVSLMAKNIESVVRKVGYSAICQAYPRFSDLREGLSVVNKKIMQSRESRQSRESFYSSIASEDLLALAELYNSFNASHDVMISIAKKERRSFFISLFISAVSIILAIIFYFFPVST